MKALFKIVDGLDLKNPYAQLRASIDGEFFKVEEREFKVFRPVTTASYKIHLKNIIANISTNEHELIEQNKSAIGRGVVGGLIFGPAGIILGGLSGVGTKKSVKKRQYFIVSYLSSDGEICNITFLTDSVSDPVTTKLFNKHMIKKLARVKPVPEVEELQAKIKQEEKEENTETIL
ncbi:hypothetical protein [Cytobacillus purgationiresistens]|uniref:Uncharacterized protein n=1 Tax=Cytobacillus purgationiresistens TaxID=863449 RepID=A0ABU0AF99_9BACI|nr:hypothetical protein [Cytobacillus purgationiresistens]MDQ0269934.1 hypothetical protein [Cytobacillus purgationiresistens]